MAFWHIEPTKLDRWLAAEVEKRASPRLEKPTRIITQAADEHVLLGLAAGLWLASRIGTPEQRRKADHIAASVVAADLSSRILKRCVAQERPDRRMVHGRRRGIPRSGHAYGAFPSGHAMHIGAVSSALSRFFPAAVPAIWAVGGLLASTRVLLLAHWPSDVAVGLGTGVGIEHLLWWLFRGSPRPQSNPTAPVPSHVASREDQNGAR
jgi:undecaprenyl-diphosphatase